MLPHRNDLSRLARVISRSLASVRAWTVCEYSRRPRQGSRRRSQCSRPADRNLTVGRRRRQAAH
jgi:hypothetical protein